MSLQSVTDSVTNPAVAVPVATIGTLANWVAELPHVVTIGWLIYVVLLICHKGWSMYKEWRDDPTAPLKRRRMDPE